MGGLKFIVLVTLSAVLSTKALPNPVFTQVIQTNEGPVVNTNVGTIRGLNSDDGTYSMFLGIPYATVNASNPFGLSTPQPSFTNTFDAIDDSIRCIHREEVTPNIIGSIDCLNINVYVPSSASSENPLPVMVWIHGGGFIWGSGDRTVYGPEYLVRHDVILVTFNYRLGIYGFMCLDIPEVPGNQAVRDQIIALRWVKNNIQTFGGDNNRITIFGESAGAWSVDIHYLYGENDLFNQIILQSGIMLSPGPRISVPNPQGALTLAQSLGSTSNNIYDALEFLSTVSPEVLIERSYDLGIFISGLTCLENEYEGVQRIISDYPLNVPDTKNMPILIGRNSHETLYRFIDESLESLQATNNFEFVLNLTFTYGDHRVFMEENLRRFYLTSDDTTSDRYAQNVRMDLNAYTDDFWFGHPIHRTIRKYGANGNPPIYMYLFSYVGERNLWKNRLTNREGGAVHYDEIAYLFERETFRNTSVTSEDQLTIDRMTTMWTNFAKFSNPTPEVTELIPVQWLPVTPGSLNYLDINQNLTAGRRPHSRRIAYVDLFFDLHEEYLIGTPTQTVPTQAASTAFLHPLIGLSLIMIFKIL